MENELFRKHRNAVLLAFVVVVVFALFMKGGGVVAAPGGAKAGGILGGINSFFAQLSSGKWLQFQTAKFGKGGAGLDRTGSAPLSASALSPTDAANTQIGGIGDAAMDAYGAADLLMGMGGSDDIGAASHANRAAHGPVAAVRGYGFDNQLVGRRVGSRF